MNHIVLNLFLIRFAAINLSYKICILEWIGWHGNVEQRTRGIAMATTTTAPAVEQGMSR